MTVREEIQFFNKKTDELIRAKYLLADVKIGEVLKSIASSELLYDVFSHFSEGYDYSEDKARAFQEQDGKGVFTMPENEGDLIAFVFFLLLEIDGKKEDLFSICKKYFPSEESNQVSYERFCASVIVPFKEIVNKTVQAVLSASSDGETEGKKTENRTIDGFKAVIEGEKKKLSGKDKEEAEFVLDKLIDYAYSGDKDGLGLAFIALKYLTEAKKTNIDLDKITDGIINL